MSVGELKSVGGVVMVMGKVQSVGSIELVVVMGPKYIYPNMRAGVV